MSNVKSPNTGTKVVGGIAAGIVAILGTIFAVEGGYVNNPKDPGGETNHGVTVAVARDHGYTGSMKDLTKGMAEEIYYTDYIKKPGYEEVCRRSLAVCHKLIDAGVNAGPSRSSRWFQQALNSLNRGGTDYPQLTVDGKVGPGTVSAYTKLEAKRGRVKACELVLKLVDVQQGQHYMSLTHLNTFTVGWVDHRLQNVPLSKCEEVSNVVGAAP